MEYALVGELRARREGRVIQLAFAAAFVVRGARAEQELLGEEEVAWVGEVQLERRL